MTPRDVSRLAQDLATCPERTIEAALQARHLDPAERAAVKIEIDACRAEKRISASGLATDQTLAPGHMHTDTTAPRDMAPLGPEMRALFRKARIDPSRSYSQAELNDALDRSELDPASRIAIKVQMAEMGQQRASRATVQATRDMSARAERPRGSKILLDPVTRQPAVLRSQPV
jgi:hypothetical protein